MEPVTEADRAELDRPQEKWELPETSRNKRDEEVVKEEELNPKMIGVSVVIDLFLASLGAIGIYLYKKLGKSVLTLTGFHCGDESLAYPYHSSTIPAWLNAIVGVFVPVIIVVADRLVKAKRNASLDDKQSVVLVLWKMFPTLIAFLAGCSLQHTFTDVAKYQVGRLRPHFLEVCQPAFYVNGELVNCSSSNIRDFEYIPDFECTSTKYSPSRQKEARISFPSGHCSFAFYAMTFAFIYSHFQLPKRFTTFLGVITRPFVQFSCLCGHGLLAYLVFSTINIMHRISWPAACLVPLLQHSLASSFCAYLSRIKTANATVKRL